MRSRNLPKIRRIPASYCFSSPYRPWGGFLRDCGPPPGKRHPFPINTPNVAISKLVLNFYLLLVASSSDRSEQAEKDVVKIFLQLVDLSRSDCKLPVASSSHSVGKQRLFGCCQAEWCLCWVCWNHCKVRNIPPLPLLPFSLSSEIQLFSSLFDFAV